MTVMPDTQKAFRTAEFTFIKITKSLFSAHKLIKATSAQTEMLTIFLTIIDIVQLSTINLENIL